MKKFGIFCVALIAVFIALMNLGSILLLTIMLGIMYMSIKGFLKAEGSMGKIFWGAVAVATLFLAVGNLPAALIGVVAIVVLVYLYKHHQGEKKQDQTFSDDLFDHFEQEWNRLNKEKGHLV